MRPQSRPRLLITLALLLAVLTGAIEAAPAKGKKKKEAQKGEDPYAEYVWPPPPDEPRIKLEQIFAGREDIEARSKFRKYLLGESPQAIYDRLKKPHAVAFDSQGSLLVTDWGTSALIRFDRNGAKMDVLGTQGNVRLKQPLGLAIGPEDVAYVADPGLKRVVAFDRDGKLRAVFGREGELVNPTDVALSPDGERLYVTDSKQHKVVVYDRASAAPVASFGRRGEGEGEFNFPSALAFGPEGDLFVVDQINGRVQVFAADGEYLDQFGGLGIGYGLFTRPKDVAVDEAGLIYVTDNAFNNVQLFDADFTLLTFVGEGGRGPGRFYGASGIAVRGAEFAVVDQLGHRVQVFRFLVPKGT